MTSTTPSTPNGHTAVPSTLTTVATPAAPSNLQLVPPTAPVTPIAGSPTLDTAASQVPIDAERLDMFYKARDDYKAQIAAADARAMSLLTFAPALIGASAITTPIILTQLPISPAKHPDVPPVFQIVANLAYILILVITVLIALAAFVSFIKMVLAAIETLTLEHIDPPKRFTWRIIWRAITTLSLTPIFRDQNSKGIYGEVGLPFSATSCDSPTFTQDMQTLDIAEAILNDIHAKAAVASAKTTAITKTMLALASQIFALLLFLGCLSLLSYLARFI